MSPKARHRQTRQIQYKCEDCGAEFSYEDSRTGLLVKRAVWVTMGEGGRHRHGRATKWQCVACAEADPDWKRERFLDAPGMADVRASREEET